MSVFTSSLVTSPVPAVTVGLVPSAGSAPAGVGGKAGVVASAAGALADAEALASAEVLPPPAREISQTPPAITTTTRRPISAPVRAFLRLRAAIARALRCLASARFSALVNNCGSTPFTPALGAADLGAVGLAPALALAAPAGLAAVDLAVAGLAAVDF